MIHAMEIMKKREEKNTNTHSAWERTQCIRDKGPKEVVIVKQREPERSHASAWETEMGISVRCWALVIGPWLCV